MRAKSPLGEGAKFVYIFGSPIGSTAPSTPTIDNWVVA